MHKVIDLKVLYFGTPVVLIGSRNEDGSANLAPISSAWWLGQSCMLGLGNASQTSANLRREGECVLNLPSSAQVDAVDALALLTANPHISEMRREQGYRHERRKFEAAGMTELAGELVRAPRAAECPVQLECRLEAATPLAGNERCTAFEVKVVRAHVEERLIVPGSGHYVDPVGWDPLIMKFCEFFGDGRRLAPSRLAEGWQMPGRLPGRLPGRAPTAAAV
ncbi:flavin reductase family protein [Kitasatospora sp. NPDC085464]|uniref:flavin reductase family protein n=1 Tax=Kitasatospora sp. NPDC085464 TaxID=3364063 RepID=UPI0037CAED51